MMSPSSPDDHIHTKKKRVGKACDLCRIKKTKCDGKKPCSRCIADNKLCAFTEKKKHKDKSHPSGYIELLETRLDLLTKSLEKIVHLSEPHLPFLQDLMAQARSDHTTIKYEDDQEAGPHSTNYVPINEVVAYLISEMGLLDHVPLEWECGALIAANVLPSTVAGASREFANHKLEDDETNPSCASPALRHSRTNSSGSMDLPDEGASLITEQLNMDDISLGGFSNLQKLQHPQAHLLSLFGLDFPRANLLFLNNEANSPQSLLHLLTHRLETHDLEPTPRRLSSVKGPISPSHQKMKQSGHVHKAHSNNHSHSHTNVVLNNGNEFHFPKAPSLTVLLPDFASSLLRSSESQMASIFDDDFEAFGMNDLPSAAYDPSNLHKLNLLDDTVNGLTVNNSFLN